MFLWWCSLLPAWPVPQSSAAASSALLGEWGSTSASHFWSLAFENAPDKANSFFWETSVGSPLACLECLIAAAAFVCVFCLAAIQQQSRVALVTREWVLDSVACYQCQELRAYLMSWGWAALLNDKIPYTTWRWNCSLKLYVNIKNYWIINVKQILKVGKCSVWPPQRNGDVLLATAASLFRYLGTSWRQLFKRGLLGLGFEFKHTCTLESPPYFHFA